MPTTPCEDCTVLNKANKKIADLKEDIRRLSDEQKKKDSLLSRFMEVASEQCKQITSFNATFDFLPAQLLTIRNHGLRWWSVVGTVGRPGLPRQLTWTSPTATRYCPMMLWLTKVTQLLRFALSWTHHQARHRPTLSLHLGKTVFRQVAPLPRGWIDSR